MRSLRASYAHLAIILYRSTGAIAGIAVVGASLFIVGALLLLFCLRRRRHSTAPHSPHNDIAKPYVTPDVISALGTHEAMSYASRVNDHESMYFTHGYPAGAAEVMEPPEKESALDLIESEPSVLTQHGPGWGGVAPSIVSGPGVAGVGAGGRSGGANGLV